MPDEWLIAATADLTPAQIRELVKRACVRSLQREQGGEWSRSLTAEDVGRGLESLRASQATCRERPIGLVPPDGGLAREAGLRVAPSPPPRRV